ncbi:MAG: pteridine-dependent deoxygenase like protein [Pseudomonadota bacterium]
MAPIVLSMPPVDPAAAAAEPVALCYFGCSSDADETAVMRLPALNVPQVEQWVVNGPLEHLEQDHLQLFKTPDYLLALSVTEPAPADLHATSRIEYQRLLTAIHRHGYTTPVRFWNYIPDINRGAADAELYKQFCWGRAEAFDEIEMALPAATGIGSFDGRLRIAVLASRPGLKLTHVENPRQIAAYRYPRQYGPRSPSFARATFVGDSHHGLLLVSGTASIVDHETRHEGDFVAQVEETRRNIDALLDAALQRVDGVRDFEPQAVRFYLRDAGSLAQAESSYARSFDGFPAAAFFQGEICRRGLAMEVEMVLSARTR